MRILFILIISINCLLSFDIVTSGNVELSTMKKKDKSINLIDLNINNDILFTNSKLATSIGTYQTSNTVYNNNVKTFVDETEIYRINELYYTQYLTDKVSISIGQFPFKKGTFYEYGFNGNRTGIGLYTLSDANLQGGIITYKNKQHTLQVGSVAYEKYFTSYKDYKESDGPITFGSYKNSGMNYISYKYERDKWYSELMLTDTYQYVNDVKIMDTDTISLALSYDDEMNTGRTYYTIFTHSNTKGDTSSLSPLNMSFTTDYYHFDKFETSGYSWLLGFKQEYDSLLFNKDMVFGMEYLHRSEGYHSLLAGEPLSYDNYSNIGDTYNVYTGIRFNKNVLLKLRYYQYKDNGKMTKPILSTVTTDSSNGKSSGNYHSYSLQLYIEF